MTEPVMCAVLFPLLPEGASTCRTGTARSATVESRGMTGTKQKDRDGETMLRWSRWTGRAPRHAVQAA